MIRKLVLATFATVAVTGAFAQKRTVELTIDKAVEIALSDNPTIQVADMEIERYDYVKKESQSALYPNLSGTASYTRSIIQQTMSGLKFGADNTFAGGLSLSLPLIAPGIWRNVQMTKEQMLGAVESARGSKIELAAEVRKTYYNVLMLRQSLDVLYANEQNVASTVDDIQKKFDNGLVSEYDLITVQVQQSNFRPNIISAENSLAVVTMMLKMYLNIPEDVDVTVTGNLEEMMAAAPVSSGELSADVSANSDLRMMDIQKNILNSQLRLVNSQRMPTLAAFGQAQLIGMDNKQIDFATMMGPMLNPLFENAGLPPLSPGAPPKYKYNWQNPISVGVSLSVPIFAGRTIDWQARQVKNAIRQIDMSAQYAAEGARVQANTAINNMLAANEKMLANHKTVEQAKKGYDIAKTRYGAGAGTVLEMNTAELNMTNAQLNYTGSISEYLSARADYDKVTGREK